jgi:hypothetical protein
MRHFGIGLLTMVVVVSAALISSSGSALPVSNLNAAAEGLSTDVQSVLWVCRSHHRCYVMGPGYRWYSRPYYGHYYGWYYRPWYYRPY